MGKPFHTYISILLALSLLAMLAACGNVAAKRLELADNVMEENPDSALAIIESIDTASLTRERDLRLRDLLLAQAKFKIFQEASIDTVSLKASNEYFSRHPRKDYLLRSNYYLGYLAFIDSSFNKGMSYAADAFYESKDFDNSIWTARSAELISFILGRCNMARESLVYDSIAMREYMKAGKLENALYSKIDHALDLGSLYHYDQADKLFCEILPVVLQKFPQNKRLIRYSLSNAIEVKIELGKYAELDTLLHMQSKYIDDSELNAIELLSRARYQLYLGDLQKAKSFMDEARSKILNGHDAESYQNVRKKYAAAKNDSIEMRNALIASIPVYRHLSKLRRDNVPVQILQEKSETHLNKKLDHGKRRLLIILVIAAFALAGVAVLFYFIHKSNKTKRIEYDVMARELKDIENKIIEYKDMISEYEASAASYQNAISAYKNTIDNFSRRSSSDQVERDLEKNKSKKIWHDFYHSTKNIIPIQNIVMETLRDLNGTLQNDRDRISRMDKRLKKLINAEFSDQLYSTLCIFKEEVVKKLNEQVPGLSYSVLKYFVFSASGLSSRAISYLLDEDITKTYSTKARLVKKIKEADPQDKAFFLSIINGKEESAE